MGSWKHKPGWWALMIVAIAGVMLGLGWVVMSLWNWLVPSLFSGPEMSYLQSLGLLVLVKILVTPFGSKHKQHHCPNCHGKGKKNWKSSFAEKYHCLDEEEKARLRNCFGEKFENADKQVDQS